MHTLPPKDTTVIMVAAQGKVTVPYDTAFMRVVITGRGETTGLAKQDASQHIEHLLTTINTWKDDGIIRGVNSTESVYPCEKYVNHENVPDGYGYYFDISFLSSKLEDISGMMDTLTNMSGHVRVDAPQFRVTHTEDMLRDALTDAWEHIKRDFAFQCHMLGFDPEEFKVCWWTTRKRTGDDAFAIRAGAAPPSAPQQRTQFSEATCTAFLEVGFARV